MTLFWSTIILARFLSRLRASAKSRPTRTVHLVSLLLHQPLNQPHDVFMAWWFVTNCKFQWLLGNKRAQQASVVRAHLLEWSAVRWCLTPVCCIIKNSHSETLQWPKCRRVLQPFPLVLLKQQYGKFKEEMSDCPLTCFSSYFLAGLVLVWPITFYCG